MDVRGTGDCVVDATVDVEIGRIPFDLRGSSACHLCVTGFWGANVYNSQLPKNLTDF